ncbi:MAG: D-alanyl-D-alanine carboxypeptidase family protein [Peptostreptococcus porci]|uniref:D-alanyl-D-alanine carboxypeptidase family protein n=1 Tax=Peptostreptococcus porci TaxID=2652282 RepID=UPI002A913621|nr:D-alanyl-D-alanine carboxypeptidase family protein [Peptostreptococcus porci]MDY5479101.1 D-alanyl-D-alanine carboxypeptidase family protein [Peptostreptococcus porci]
MKKIASKLIVLVSTITLFSTSTILSFAEIKDFDNLKAKYMVLMDYDSGKILYEKNAENKIYPASTTKIWTAFCVIEKAKDLNEQIEIKDMPEVDGSSMYLENGEKFTVNELLESLLIHSSNDVAYVLAKHFGGGNPQKFIDFMNEEAKKYGAKKTHFNNPHGLPDENHYTTAKDMTILSRVAYGDNLIKSIVAKKSVKFKVSNTCKVERTLINSNKFLTSTDSMDYKGKQTPIKYDVVDGIKTGYTDDAGNCLVSTGEKDGIRMISSVFFAPSGNLYHDSRALLDYGFDNFKTVTIFDKKDLVGEKNIKFASPSKVKFSPANSFSVTQDINEKINTSDYTKKFDFDKLDLPVKKGDVIGTMNVYQKTNMVSSIALIAENDVNSYWDIIKSKIPFLNDEDKNSSKDSSTSTNDTSASDSSSNDKSAETDSNKSNADNKNEAGVVNKVVNSGKTVKSEIENSAHGIWGMLKEIKGFFTNTFGGGFSTFEKSSFYKFLDDEISSKIKIIPSKYIIIGVPVIVILLFLILIIGILKDAILGRLGSRKAKNDIEASELEDIDNDSSDSNSNTTKPEDINSNEE